MARSPLPGPNILLIGASGVGKTTSIKTLIAKGITPFCLFTEPGFEVLGDVPSAAAALAVHRPCIGAVGITDSSGKKRHNASSMMQSQL